MKRFVIAIVLAMCFSLFGCGKKQNEIKSLNQQATDFEKNDFQEKAMFVDEQEHLKTKEARDERAVIVNCSGMISSESYGKNYEYQVQIINEKPHEWNMQFTLKNVDEICQIIESNIDFDIEPCTIHVPVTIEDINEDGNYDFIIDYGILGKARKANCIVWNPNTGSYEVLEGYKELCNVNYDKRTRITYESYDGNGGEKINNQYVVRENKLELVASMIEDWSSVMARYTEKRMINGEFVITQDNLPESKTSFEGWLNH